MESVDVAILTLNSELMLRECIDSVYANVPVHNLIIVDGNSTDDTEKIAQDFQKKFGNVIFIQEKGTRGTARQTAISHVQTDWFMFVDSDVLLSKNWLMQAQKQVLADVGAVWGIEIWSVMRGKWILPLLERFTLKIFEKRGGTHDILIRRKTVADIKIPYQLHTYEDGFIKDWIEKKGFRVLGVYEPYCFHFRADSIWTMQKHIELAVSDVKYAANHPVLLPSYLIYSIIVSYQIAVSKLRRKS